MNNRIAAIAVTGLVIVHHTIAIQHGSAHTELAIVLAPWKNSFIDFVIIAMPLFGAAMLWTRHAKFGLWLVAIGMLAALIFGVIHHYMLESTDHISHLPEGLDHTHGTFIWTAGAITILECVSASAAAYLAGVKDTAV